MSRSEAWYLSFIQIANLAEDIGIAVVSAVCFALWIRSYLSRRRAVIAAGGVIALGGILGSRLFVSGGLSVFVPTLAIACGLLYLWDREKPQQKIFLCTLFLTVRFISTLLLSELGFLSIHMDRIYGSPMARMSPDQMMLYYAGEVALTVVLHGLLLYLLLALAHRAYPRQEELNGRELLLLLIPTVTPLLVREPLRDYFVAYSQGQEAGYITENIPPSAGRVLLYIMSFLALLLMLYLYERLRREREEAAQRDALEQELLEVRRSIAQTEQRYQEQRALRHDIANHLMTMEHLAERGAHQEARSYLERLKEEYAGSIEGIRCGDPVLDAVLTAKRDDARRQGIAFECEFHAPGQSGLDVFDLSVLLSNALDNALRGASGSKPWIRLRAQRREHFLTILVTNSYDGAPPRLDTDGLPLTTKTGEGHGLGLKLIRRIALKYRGEAEFITREKEVQLRVLLQEAEQEA